jgi:CRISPR-associated protein Cas1
VNSIARRPTQSKELIRASDRISFLYLERCAVNRDSSAITATDEHGTVHVPAASVGVLIMGPGTTVTHQAILLLSDSGSTMVWVGEHGVRYYAHGASLARSARLLEAQAASVSHPKERLRVARAMYQMRFPDEDVSSFTMQQLRGREGARIRRTYREQSDRTGVKWSRRTYDIDDWEGDDPVNQALSAANAALYGVVHSVVVALGCAPGLGFIHTGQQRSFVYDVADIYKADHSIPAAFDVAAEAAVDVGSRARRRMREQFRDGQLLTRCARDIQTLLLGDQESAEEGFLDFEVLSLWDDRAHPVAAGTSYEADF